VLGLMRRDLDGSLIAGEIMLFPRVREHVACAVGKMTHSYLRRTEIVDGLQKRKKEKRNTVLKSTVKY